VGAGVGVGVLFDVGVEFEVGVLLLLLASVSPTRYPSISTMAGSADFA